MKKANSAFFRGDRKSSWLMVAYGMIGASLSGVSFVSVPGMTIFQDMTYMQTCLGFILGYLFVAFVLLPVYYRSNLTSIYALLGEHRKIGSAFFILSDLLGAAVKFFLVCTILQQFVFNTIGLPFLLSVPLMVIFIWLYTRRSGVKTLVLTDVLQTTCMLLALVFITINVCQALHPQLPTGTAITTAFSSVIANSHSRMFEFGNFISTQNFWKQFLSGIFIVIVMTGLNQNMMQKNLTCKSLRDAQKDMSLCGLFFLPVNYLFLALGVLLIMLADSQGCPLPNSGDQLLPMFIQDMSLGTTSLIFFTIGIVSAAFSSADSSLTALTTSICVDLYQREEDEPLRKRVHIAMAVIFILIVYLLQYVGSKSLIDLVYILVSYTYGPLLGLFAYHFLPKLHHSHHADIPQAQPINKLHLFICILSPILCYLLDQFTTATLSYHFGYELLLLNGLLTFIGLLLCPSSSCRSSCP